jgi:plasmid maintenance system antidote protein VapI
VSEVISGKRAITPETAVALGEALGTGAEFLDEFGEPVSCVNT